MSDDYEVTEYLEGERTFDANRKSEIYLIKQRLFEGIKILKTLQLIQYQSVGFFIFNNTIPTIMRYFIYNQHIQALLYIIVEFNRSMISDEENYFLSFDTFLNKNHPF